MSMGKPYPSVRECELELQALRRELERREHLLQAARLATEALLGPGDFDASVNRALEILGLATGVNRVYVWHIHASPHPEINPELHTSQLYEWCQNADPQQDQDLCINRPVSESMPTWMDVFLAGKCVNSLVKDMHPLERAQLDPQGIVSIMTAPIMISGELWGFIGFDECRREYVWTPAEENILRMAGTQLGAAICNRRAQNALTESQSRFHMVEEATGDVVWELDSELRFVYVSDKVTPVLGYTPREMVGRKWRDFQVGEDYFWNIMPTPGSPILRSLEELLRAKDGSLVWMRNSAFCLFDEEGRLAQVFGASQNVSEVRQAHMELQKTKGEIEALNAQLREAAYHAHSLAEKAEKAGFAKNSFLSQMSHEIRTPMNAVMGLLRLLMRTELNDVQADFLTKMDFAARSLMHTVNDVLDFSSIETGTMTIESVPFFVDDVVRGISASFQQEMDKKGLELRFVLASSVSGQFLGDPFRLRQVLMSLVSNAVTRTTKGVITLSVLCRNASLQAAELLFEVQAEGASVPGERAKEVGGNPFNLPPSGGLSTEKGLGLALSKRLVTLMRGDIWGEISPWGGCSFSFTVQVEPVEKNGILATELKNFTVLAVDEDSMALEELAALLSSIGCRSVETATDVGEARARLQSFSDRAAIDLLVFGGNMASFSYGDFATWLSGPDLPRRPQVVMVASRHQRAFVPARLTTSFITPPVTQARLYEALVQPLHMASLSASFKEQNLEREMVREFVSSRILVVEDNEINQMVVEELLVQAGMKVTIAANGKEALRLLEEQAFSLILMDIQMPEMDGLTASRAIRAQTRFAQVPIIAMTANAMSDDRQKSLDAGMNDHITKPVDSFSLFRSLAHWLGRSREEGYLCMQQ